MNQVAATATDQQPGWRKLLPGIGCALAVALCVLLVHPVLEMGTNDDWSYIKTAQTFAATGHFVYNGWATAMLGWQIPWGALFVRLFGFSFFAVRMSTVVLAMASGYLFYVILLRFGLSTWNAVFGALVLMLSPLSLPLTTSFMTDIPGVFSILVCLYFCLRALTAKDVRAALLWLCLAAGSNVVLGTVRQIVWLGALVMVPSTFWLLRRYRRFMAIGLLLWLCSIVSLFACLQWFQHQPYSLPEKLITGRLNGGAIAHFFSRMLRLVLTLLLCIFPVLAAWFSRMGKQKHATLAKIAIVLALFLPILFWAHKKHTLDHFLPPWLGNILSRTGISQVNAIMGNPPTVLPTWAMLALGFALIAATLIAIATIWEMNWDRVAREPGVVSITGLGWRETLIILVPFTLANFVLLVPRGLDIGLWDRYILPIMIPVLILLLRVCQQEFGRRLPLFSYATLALFTWFSVAGTHDEFAISRARLQAANEVTDAGVPRTALSGGVEYDGWTQIEAQGYINDDRLVNPPGSYHPSRHANESCRKGDLDRTPAVVPVYVLTYTPVDCLLPSRFAPVNYRTWLAPSHRMIYVQQRP